ncbi:MAG: phosphoribosylamine--glycine ligase [Actinobacteria bacterium]|nr:phosphoribosylamine--glycine ligase [Actinomycetota bacterium]
MRALVVGSGGREHALTRSLVLADSVDEVLCAPGNPGMAEIAECVAVATDDPAAVAHLADARAVDLVVVGPEQPLVDGMVDAVSARGRLAFGPTADGARLEGSKAYMKEVLVAAGVPTAAHRAFGADDEAAALAFLETLPGFYVVKTDGLAAGKGVVVTESIDEARDAVRAYLSGAAFGDAGRTLVIEEGLAGPELSLLVVCNGDTEGARPLAPAQDFKRIGDGDAGPNTGGMGAYSPVPMVDDALVADVMRDAVVPTLRELERRGIAYRGVLYAGLMLTAAGPKMLEYNVRFGDPECEVVVPRLETDLGELCRASAAGEPLPEIRFTDDACVTVVLASEGYPTSPRTGDPIAGLAEAAAVDGALVFHAGTRREGADIVTAGGRVLTVSGFGPTVAAARACAYAAADRIHFSGRQHRSDIAAGV